MAFGSWTAERHLAQSVISRRPENLCILGGLTSFPSTLTIDPAGGRGEAGDSETRLARVSTPHPTSYVVFYTLERRHCSPFSIRARMLQWLSPFHSPNQAWPLFPIFTSKDWPATVSPIPAAFTLLRAYRTAGAPSVQRGYEAGVLKARHWRRSAGSNARYRHVGRPDRLQHGRTNAPAAVLPCLRGTGRLWNGTSRSAARLPIKSLEGTYCSGRAFFTMAARAQPGI